MWKLKDGRIINSIRNVTWNGKKLNPKVFRDPTLMKSVGIKYYQTENYDQKYYNVTQKHVTEDDLHVWVTYDLKPAMTLQELKDLKLARLKEVRNERLANTDQYVLWALELGQTVPQVVQDIRSNIRTKYAQAVTLINAQTDYATLVALFPSLTDDEVSDGETGTS